MSPPNDNFKVITIFVLGFSVYSFLGEWKKMLLFNKKCSKCGQKYDKTLDKCPSCQIDNDTPLNRRFNKNVVFLDTEIQVGLFFIGFSYLGMLIVQFFLGFFINVNTIGGKTLLTCLSYGIIFIGLLALALTNRPNLFISRFKRWQDYLIGIAYAAVLIGLGLLIPIIMHKITGVPMSGDEIDNTNQKLARDMVRNYPIPTFFILTIIGPICEEITYRVGLFTFLKRINTVLAFIVSSLVFAAVHFNFTAENMTLELIALPSYIVLGLLLTLAYQHRGPACSMVAHMSYNVLAWVMLFNK